MVRVVPTLTIFGKTCFLLISENEFTALSIFAKMHFLLISENELTQEIKRDGITSFTDFVMVPLSLS